MYHNKKFKEVAEQHGLTVDKDSKYGYCITKLNDEATAFVQAMQNKPLMIISRNLLLIGLP